MEDKDIFEEIEMFDDDFIEEPKKGIIEEIDLMEDFGSYINSEEIEEVENIEFEEDFIIDDIVDNKVENNEIINIDDLDIPVPNISDNFDLGIEIIEEEDLGNQNNINDVDNKKSMVFIGVLFAILILFVIALPYVRNIIGR